MVEKDAAHVPKTIHPFKKLHLNNTMQANSSKIFNKKKRSRSFSSVRNVFDVFDSRDEHGYTSDSHI